MTGLKDSVCVCVCLYKFIVIFQRNHTIMSKTFFNSKQIMVELKSGSFSVKTCIITLEFSQGNQKWSR